MARQRIKPQQPPAPDPDTAPEVSPETEAIAAPETAQAAPDAAPAPGRRKRTSGAASTAPGAAPPATAAEALAANPAAADLAQQLIDELDNKTPPQLPFSTYPHPSESLNGLVSTVIDEGADLDLVKEFDELVKLLEIREALTPQVVRARINEVESCARRAHRLFVLTKAQYETYKIHAETALGAMRDSATAALSADKLSGKHAKQVTIQDVDDRAAVMFPDAWSDIKDRLRRSGLTLDHLQRFADLWQRRSWSLSSLNQ